MSNSSNNSSILSKIFGRTGTFNSVQNQAPTVNHDGYPSWKANNREQTLQTLLTNTLGNTYYTTQRGNANGAEELLRQMAKEDPEFLAKACVFARKNGYMRSLPVLGLAMLLSESPEHAEKVFHSVLGTPNDLSDLVAVMNGFGKKLNGRRAKRLGRTWLQDKVGEYWAIKYGNKLRPLVRHFHPQNCELFRYIRAKTGGNMADLSGLPQVQAFEDLKRAETAETKCSAIKNGRLPHEVASTFAGKDAQVWEQIVPQLPIMALIKNLATLDRHGVLDSNRKLIESKLCDPKVIASSKQLPFRFLDAHEAISSPWAKDALKKALDLSCNNLPEIKGRTAVLLDISGSMEGRYLQIGGIFAIALMRKMQEDGLMVLFDTICEEFPVSTVDSVLSQASKIRARGGTDTGMPVRLLREAYQKIRDKDAHQKKKYDKFDNIIMITDEQQNSGNHFYDEFRMYQKMVNRNAKAFIVDVSQYGHRMTPDDDPSVHYITGWSDKVLQFIAMKTQGFSGMVDRVLAMEI